MCCGPAPIDAKWTKRTSWTESAPTAATITVTSRPRRELSAAAKTVVSMRAVVADSNSSSVMAATMTTAPSTGTPRHPGRGPGHHQDGGHRRRSDERGPQHPAHQRSVREREQRQPARVE